MARPRRAKNRPGRVLVPLLAVAVAGAGVVGWQLRDDPTPAGPAARTSSSPVVAGPTAGTSPTPTASAAPDDAAATTALAGCRRHVRAGDDVVAAARTGVGHWAEHVQAQTDADAGRVSVAEMDGTFARTRLAGPADLERWRDARRAYAAADGSCAAVEGASAAQSRALERCRARDEAHRPVIAAAGPAMADWKSHLSAMMRSRMEDVPDAEDVWLRAWRAAPPHIEAFEKSERELDAPRC